MRSCHSPATQRQEEFLWGASAARGSLVQFELSETLRQEKLSATADCTAQLTIRSKGTLGVLLTSFHSNDGNSCTLQARMQLACTARAQHLQGVPLGSFWVRHFLHRVVIATCATPNPCQLPTLWSWSWRAPMRLAKTHALATSRNVTNLPSGTE